jgi:WD40 repeat protein
VILKGVSSQLVSASERANAGIPTVMTTTDVYIAVGTSHGLVLVFDGQQALKFSLGGVGANENGAVSSMSFNPESTRVLVGFAKGQISEFDLTSGKLTMTLADVHPLGSAVVHTRFTDDPSIALMADSGGSVYEVKSKKHKIGYFFYSPHFHF